MDLDVRRLRVLHEVALRGGVTAAAAALHVTPSAVSQQLGQLAREAGHPLVERSGRGVVLTTAGQILALHAERILGAVEQAVTGLAVAHRQVAGTVRVGAFPSAAGALVVPAAARAMAAHPGLDVRVVEAEDDQSRLDLRSATLDIVVLQEYDHVPGTTTAELDRYPIATDPMHLITPVGWGRDSGRLADLADVPWVASAAHTPCGRSTLRACHLAGFEPDIRHRAIDFALTLDMVAAGLGAALVPGMALRHVPPRVLVRPLAKPVTGRRIFAVTRPRGAGPTHPAIAAVLTELAGPDLDPAQTSRPESLELLSADR
ncbi:LysR family transcriptional regulator [Plantactinospora sp. S1510]|uniref:LysR family transcriptional regulator n=1 Tax=Plantactinospora alkalitolerans TaxID=2789879 RepID=A0ABS0GNV2_9ACTN|nr:LysR family transcriptional regulator [Plantactinospora alkalitolerans]MBF9127866.1 LysR family transcriptional regulator [Plantactinospora alkalitolerans]